VYRAEHIHDNNPELVTLNAQDHASSMAYWAEVELGIETIHGLQNNSNITDEEKWIIKRERRGNSH